MQLASLAFIKAKKKKNKITPTKHHVYKIIMKIKIFDCVKFCDLKLQSFLQYFHEFLSTFHHFHDYTCKYYLKLSNFSNVQFIVRAPEINDFKKQICEFSFLGGVMECFQIHSKGLYKHPNDSRNLGTFQNDYFYMFETYSEPSDH